MNNNNIIIPKRIVTVDKDDLILSNTAVEIIDSRITSFIPFEKIDWQGYEGKIYDYPDLTLIPGFVQTHIHLCQTLFRSLADDLQLLEWLQKKIFPFENAHDKKSLEISTKLGINELLLGGTTTLLDMGTLRHQEVVFEEMISSGIRGYSGKCLIDENELYPLFKSSTENELKYMNELANEFHNVEEGRIRYGFAPRFVLSCSEELLKETKSMMNDFPGSVYHTHSSENKNEIAEVRKKYDKENIEYFESINVLDDHTILAHCIHLNENEKQILKNRNVKVAHCPSANLKLGSGIANIPEYIERGISVSIGADGPPCNNNLSVFTEMRLAALIQKPIHGPEAMDAKTIFKLATIEGAKALHLENEVGSIEIGKKADLVLIDLNTHENSVLDNDEQVYSNLVYSSGTNNVRSVMIDGKWVVMNSESLIYDKNKLRVDSIDELKKLLKRM
ncbi:MAG: amidohydrolase family protein [Bacteroidetes bacterium]|nr:amidohydrolase family protein [Bacteroidota bacterium]MCH8032361.1 amidohydrolase family protein [Bacteroidota bacterium]